MREAKLLSTFLASHLDQIFTIAIVWLMFAYSEAHLVTNLTENRYLSKRNMLRNGSGWLRPPGV